LRPLLARVRRLLIGTLIALALTYMVILGALYATQRSLIFPAPVSFAELPGGYEQISLPTTDGLMLAAAWRPPVAGKPVLLFFHGNGDSWDGGALAMEAFSAAGYGVLLPEYRGYGANPGEPDEQGIYRDGRAALAWLDARGIKAGRVVLVGNSLGSGVATQLATETRPAALMLVSGFASLPGVVADKFPWLPARWLVRDRFDNAAKLGRVTAPVLVLHGGADTLIGPAHARRLAAANPHARLVLVPHTGHELAYLPRAQEIQKDWLDGLGLED